MRYCETIYRNSTGTSLPSPPLSMEEILSLADDYRATHGRWPNANSGRIDGMALTWTTINERLRRGHRGLPEGASLLRMLKQYRQARVREGPLLTEQQILAWADAHFARAWPLAEGDFGQNHGNQGDVVERGQCAAERRPRAAEVLAISVAGRTPRCAERPGPPALTEEAILAWADAYFAEHGRWPKDDSGRIAGTQETWRSVDNALRRGRRGLPASSLARLLKEYRGVRYRGDLPKLKERGILEWAKAHFEATGRQPSSNAGVVHAAPPETWSGIDNAPSSGNPRPAGQVEPREAAQKARAEMTAKSLCSRSGILPLRADETRRYPHRPEGRESKGVRPVPSPSEWAPPVPRQSKIQNPK